MQENKMAEKSVRKRSHDQGNKADMKSIKSLIADLASEDGVARVKARKSLVDIGHTAVGPLVEALASRQEWVRWEATKTLAQIGDPSATQALIGALHDKTFDVRWLAAEGLIHIGDRSIKPLLKTLVEHPDSLWIREGVHHVLHDLPESGLKNLVRPVLHALEDTEPSLEAAIAAESALNLLAAGSRS
jgi:HEAT repeat protein